MSNKNPFKDTLNLPKTSFPMRANLQQNEPISLKRWEEMDLYDTLQKERQDAKTFFLHDGPPYANGNIHIGHLLNKVLKDFVIRTHLMMGFSCPFVPGWDCHGLPIEHKVIQELLKKKPKLFEGMPKAQQAQIIRKACHRFSDEQIKMQVNQMKRLLTLAEYEKPYLTKNKAYEAAVLNTFASLSEKGLVYRQMKPVHWSIQNETALAEAELEYIDRTDPAVYVAFEIKESAALAKRLKFNSTRPIHCLIWTTTPWTLPANLAIAIEENYSYSIIESQEKHLIVASSLVESLEKNSQIPIDKIIATFKGSVLLDYNYKHPFIDQSSPIVHAEYVTLDSGTGLVHTAPGHGQDDYLTGQREKLACYCPVKGNGHYDDSVPDFLKGLSIWDANPVIIETLKNSGHLYYSEDYFHSYPHDWRSKTPVIFRATEQWFIAVDKTLAKSQASLRSLALKNINESLNFYPAWGQKRLNGMLESRPDWCISRQRAWGLPIPAFKTPKGEILMSPASIRAVAARIAEKGSDCWFEEEATDLLQHYDPSSDQDAPAELEIGTLEKLYDIFDVWFESGTSWEAVMGQRYDTRVADLYLEGSDQHRGWFHLSLLSSLGAQEKAPFKALLTHGFMVDKDGYKMSKSTGNALNVEDLMKQYGAEVLRWWVLSLNSENDIKVDHAFFESAADQYRKIRNTFRFLLSNLADYTADIHGIEASIQAFKGIEAHHLDAYLLQALSELQNKLTIHFKNYNYKQAFLLFQHFFSHTLSAVYCSAIKDRLYCDKANSERRRQAQKVIAFTCDTLARLCAPFIPHTADEVFHALYGEKHCIHTETLNIFEYTADPHWDSVLTKRDEVLKALENTKAIPNPLDAKAIIPTDSFPAAYLQDFADLCGVSQATFDSTEHVKIISLEDTARCERSWKRDGTVQERPSGHMLSDRDFEAVQYAESQKDV